MFAPLYEFGPTVDLFAGHHPISAEQRSSSLIHQCWEKHCNGRGFETLHDLLCHQRNGHSNRARRSALASCGVEYRRSAVRSQFGVINDCAPVIRHHEREGLPISSPAARAPTSIGHAERLTQIVEAMGAAHISDGNSSKATIDSSTVSSVLLPPEPQSRDPSYHLPPSKSVASARAVSLRPGRRTQSISRASSCPRCGANFSRSSARTLHLLNSKCLSQKDPVASSSSPLRSRRGAISAGVSKSRHTARTMTRHARLIHEVQTQRRRSDACPLNAFDKSKSPVIFSFATDQRSQIDGDASIPEQLKFEHGSDSGYETTSGSETESTLDCALASCWHCNTGFSHAVERSQHFIHGQCGALNMKHTRSASFDCGSDLSTFQTVSSSRAEEEERARYQCSDNANEIDAMELDHGQLSRGGRAVTCEPPASGGWH
ncbi:MAG: hypothetical protein Q9159_001405 [Coniocarpon cinnabarinum]